MKLIPRLAALLVVTAFTLGNAHAVGDLAPVEVFTDPTLDHDLLLEATPPYQDLIAGYIAENYGTKPDHRDGELIFTWKVVDIPDAFPNGVPYLSTYYWEFWLDVPNDEVAPMAFSLSVTPTRGTGIYSLQSEPCGEMEALIECTPVQNAHVEVRIDAVANTITAEVQRGSLRDSGGEPGGAILAVDGAVLYEAELFQGIAAFTSAVAFVPGITADTADLTDEEGYVLGSPRAA